MTGIALYVFALQQTSLPKNEVKIEVKGEYRYISSNGIPDHKTGQFPGRGNPNAISAQKYNFRVPLKPQIAEKTTDLRMQDFGVAVNGVPFDPGTAEYWNNDRSSGWHWEGIINGVAYLGIDFNNAHVQPNGAYHYHAIPVDLMKKLGGDGSKMVLVGWAADGFPMYGTFGYSSAKDPKSGVKKMKSSYRLKEGTRPSGPGGLYDGSFEQDWNFVKDSGDLDECNGRFGVTPEFPNGTYYYVVSESYPWIPRKYRGTMDNSFRRGPGGQGGPPGGPGGRRSGPPPGGGGE
jgi:hypothetical protein